MRACGGIRHLGISLKLQIYKAILRPLLEYGAEVWQPNKRQAVQLERVQRRVCRMILGAPSWTPEEAMLLDLGLEPLQDRWDLLKLCWHRKLHVMRENHTAGQLHRYPAVVADYTQGYEYRQRFNRLQEGNTSQASTPRPSPLFVHVVACIWQGLPSAALHGWADRECEHRVTLFDESHGAFQAHMKQELWARTLNVFAVSMAAKSSLQLLASTLPSLPVDQVPPRRGIRPYLRFSTLDSGCCLQFQVRAGTVLLRGKANKMPGRLHADSPACPCCGAGEETVVHALLECPAYEEDRQRLLQYFRLVHPRAWGRWTGRDPAGQAAWVLDDGVWGKGLSSEVVTLQRSTLYST